MRTTALDSLSINVVVDNSSTVSSGGGNALSLEDKRAVNYDDPEQLMFSIFRNILYAVLLCERCLSPIQKRKKKKNIVKCALCVAISLVSRSLFLHIYDASTSCCRP